MCVWGLIHPSYNRFSQSECILDYLKSSPGKKAGVQPGQDTSPSQKSAKGNLQTPISPTERETHKAIEGKTAKAGEQSGQDTNPPQNIHIMSNLQRPFNPNA